MKKILCPTDFSDTANNAIMYAAKVAQAMHADLTLFHAESLFDITVDKIIAGVDEAIQRRHAQLDAQSIAVARAFKISCYSEVLPTSHKLSTAIDEKAKDFDLIVMGSNGPDSLYQFSGRSNAYNAILKTKTPLLLVPADVQYSEIKSVAYAFDYLEQRNLPLAGLKPFVKSLHCNLKILQVMEEAYSKDAEEDLKDLQYIIKTYYDDLSYDFDTIHAESTIQGIHDYVSRNQIDVLALCSVHRNFIEAFFHRSTIQNISTFCNYPLYVFHQ